MSIDRLLSQYSAPVASWPGEEDLDDEARANLAASTHKLPTEGGATDAGSLLPITRYPPRVGTDPATWKSAADVLASLDDGWRLEPFNRISAPFKSMLDGLRTQPLLGPMVRPSQMQPEVLEQMTGDAMSVAGAGLMGNVPRVLAGAPAGTMDLGIFGGRAAKTADHAALARAEEMDAAGAPREQIWSDTGWFKGVDGKWRFEISDKHDFIETPDGGLKETGAVMRTRDKTMAGPLAQGHTPRATLSQLMTHDDLFAAYPDLKRMNVVSSGERGGWQHGETIGLGRELLEGLNDPTRTEHITKPQRVALHEIQHRIQDIEGTGTGGSPHQMKEYLVNRNDAQIEALSDRIREIEESHPAEFENFRRLNGATAMKNWDAANAAEAELLSTPIGRELADLDWRRAELARQDFEGQPAFDAYKKLAGETESRAVEKRRAMSDDERRARPPWMDYDVPEKDQIVRFGGDGKAASIDPDAPHPIDKLLDEVAPPASAPVTVPTSLDTLGYYSPLIESARSLKQAKGTPEQMLAQLKKAGVRDAEIEATGLGALLDGKKSVTRDEIVKHLEENKVGLREVVRSRGQPKFPYTTERQWDDAMQLALERGQTERYEDLSAARGDWRDGRFDDPGDTKWADYSLDPSNPTYRETVLHLPVRDRDEYAQSRWGKSYDELTSDQKQFVDAEKAAFQSGHFPEPNIVGHMMTSMTTHEGKPVYTIDQIQSDWGQSLRDLPDSAKADGLRSQLKTLGLSEYAADLTRPYVTYEDALGYAKAGERHYKTDEARAAAAEIARLDPSKFDEVRRIASELKQIKDQLSSPIARHPLVNTTDQWVNTVLRRSVRQAAEADADYIAIPSGRTVESYNPQGSSEGVDVFYDKIVPKNLRNLLQKIDKSVPDPQRIETLDSPSGKTGLGQGFTLFPLTPAIKRQVLEGGQPLFRYSSPSDDVSGTLSRANEAGYAPKPLQERPFSDDYRSPVEGVDGSPLKTDIEGRPIVAKFVAGRRTVGGRDEGLSPEAVSEIAQEIGSVNFVPRSELPRRAVGSYNPTINEMNIAADLPADQRLIALAHELGHGLAGSARKPINLEGSAVAGRKVYHDLRTGDTRATMPRQFHSPELDGYKKADVGEELRAELLRAYMMDPNYIKSTAPKAAAAIRDSINADPWLSKIVQFNVLPPVAVGLGAASVDELLKQYSEKED